MEKVLVGKYVKTHGIKGEIKIKSNFKYKDRVFKVGNLIFIGEKEFEITGYRIHQDYDMITLKGINDINEILPLKGSFVYFDKEKELLDKFYNAQEGWEEILNEPYKPDYIIIPVNAVINDYIPDNYKAVYKTQWNNLYSVNDKLKDKYIHPSEDKNYYTKNAFKKGFELKKADKKTL